MIIFNRNGVSILYFKNSLYCRKSVDLFLSYSFFSRSTLYFWYTYNFRYLLKENIIKEDPVKRFHLMRYVRAREKILKVLNKLRCTNLDLSRFVDLNR